MCYNIVIRRGIALASCDGIEEVSDEK